MHLVDVDIQRVTRIKPLDTLLCNFQMPVLAIWKKKTLSVTPLFVVIVFFVFFLIVECGLVCHVKCAPNLPHTCGLPSEFVEHFSETLHEQKSGANKTSNSQSATKLGGRREGWLRAPRYESLFF